MEIHAKPMRNSSSSSSVLHIHSYYYLLLLTITFVESICLTYGREAWSMKMEHEI